jgi:hypothetical protein
MKNDRLELHKELVKILGTSNVYYQPPESVKIKYPAIIYSRANIDNKFANNKIYWQANEYQIIIVTDDPDSELVEKMSQFQTARFERHYASSGLNHDVFKLFYKK